jgi:hypothetical protein
MGLHPSFIITFKEIYIMAKSGRAFADRKKVQSITADITLEKADCGTYMMLNVASGCTVTLPSISDAGEGWWCRFYVATNCSSNTYVIQENAGSDTDTIIGGINELEVDTSDDGPSSTGCTFITFANALDTVGDFVEVICDGSNWYIFGQSKLDGAIALT